MAYSKLIAVLHLLFVLMISFSDISAQRLPLPEDAIHIYLCFNDNDHKNSIPSTPYPPSEGVELIEENPLKAFSSGKLPQGRYIIRYTYIDKKTWEKVDQYTYVIHVIPYKLVPELTYDKVAGQMVSSSDSPEHTTYWLSKTDGTIINHIGNTWEVDDITDTIYITHSSENCNSEIIDLSIIDYVLDPTYNKFENKIDAGAGFSSYKWNGAIGGQTYTHADDELSIPVELTVVYNGIEINQTITPSKLCDCQTPYSIKDTVFENQSVFRVLNKEAFSTIPNLSGFYTTTYLNRVLSIVPTPENHRENSIYSLINEGEIDIVLKDLSLSRPEDIVLFRGESIKSIALGERPNNTYAVHKNPIQNSTPPYPPGLYVDSIFIKRIDTDYPIDTLTRLISVIDQTATNPFLKKISPIFPLPDKTEQIFVCDNQQDQKDFIPPAPYQPTDPIILETQNPFEGNEKPYHKGWYILRYTYLNATTWEKVDEYVYIIHILPYSEFPPIEFDPVTQTFISTIDDPFSDVVWVKDKNESEILGTGETFKADNLKDTIYAYYTTNECRSELIELPVEDYFFNPLQDEYNLAETPITELHAGFGYDSYIWNGQAGAEKYTITPTNTEGWSEKVILEVYFKDQVFIDSTTLQYFPTGDILLEDTITSNETFQPEFSLPETALQYAQHTITGNGNSVIHPEANDIKQDEIVFNNSYDHIKVPIRTIKTNLPHTVNLCAESSNQQTELEQRPSNLYIDYQGLYNPNTVLKKLASTGMFFVKRIDNDVIIDTIYYNISSPAENQLSFSYNSANQTLDINTNDITTAEWYNSEITTEENLVHTGLSIPVVVGKQKYYVIGKNSSGCDLQTTTVVFSKNAPPIVLNALPAIICEQDIVLLDAGSGFDTYTWNGIEGEQYFMPEGPGTVTLEATLDGDSFYDEMIIKEAILMEDILFSVTLFNNEPLNTKIYAKNRNVIPETTGDGKFISDELGYIQYIPGEKDKLNKSVTVTFTQKPSGCISGYSSTYTITLKTFSSNHIDGDSIIWCKNKPFNLIEDLPENIVLKTETSISDEEIPFETGSFPLRLNYINTETKGIIETVNMSIKIYDLPLVHDVSFNKNNSNFTGLIDPSNSIRWQIDSSNSSSFLIENPLVEPTTDSLWVMAKDSNNCIGIPVFIDIDLYNEIALNGILPDTVCDTEIRLDAGEHFDKYWWNNIEGKNTYNQIEEGTIYFYAEKNTLPFYDTVIVLPTKNSLKVIEKNKLNPIYNYTIPLSDIDLATLNYSTTGSGQFAFGNDTLIYTPSMEDGQSGNIDITLTHQHTQCREGDKIIHKLFFPEYPSLPPIPDTVCLTEHSSIVIEEGYDSYFWNGTEGSNEFVPQEPGKIIIDVYINSFAFKDSVVVIPIQETPPSVTNQSLKENETFTIPQELSEENGDSYSSSGTGIFTVSDEKAIEYTFSENDIENGSVEINTIQNLGFCTAPLESTYRIQIIDPSQFDPLPDSICETEIGVFNAPDGYDAYLWNGETEGKEYTPSGVGTVILEVQKDDVTLSDTMKIVAIKEYQPIEQSFELSPWEIFTIPFAIDTSLSDSYSYSRSGLFSFNTEGDLQYFPTLNTIKLGTSISIQRPPHGCEGAINITYNLTYSQPTFPVEYTDTSICYNEEYYSTINPNIPEHAELTLKSSLDTTSYPAASGEYEVFLSYAYKPNNLVFFEDTITLTVLPEYEIDSVEYTTDGKIFTPITSFLSAFVWSESSLFNDTLSNNFNFSVKEYANEALWVSGKELTNQCLIKPYHINLSDYINPAPLFLEGRIFDNFGLAQNGKVTAFYSSDLSTYFSTNTTNGNYRFEDIPQGTYIIFAEPDSNVFLPVYYSKQINPNHSNKITLEYSISEVNFEMNKPSEYLEGSSSIIGSILIANTSTISDYFFEDDSTLTIPVFLSHEGEVKQVMYTNTQNEFIFENLPAGNYTVTIGAAGLKNNTFNVSLSDDESKTISAITAITNVANRNSIQVYPTPSGNHFTVDCKENSTIELYNNLGQKLLSTTQHKNINISSFASGMYQGKVINKHQTLYFTLIKK